MMSSLGRLLPNNPASELIKLDLVKFRRRYGIPDSIWLRLPLSGERVDWRIPGWVPIDEVPFKMGFHFPLPPLVVGVLPWYEIARGQLMPNSWRIMLSLVALSK